MGNGINVTRLGIGVLISGDMATRDMLLNHATEL